MLNCLLFLSIYLILKVCKNITFLFIFVLKKSLIDPEGHYNWLVVIILLLMAVDIIVTKY